MVDIKLYTVKDLREWLEHNQAAEGLSERVIAPTRAWAIIHNPYVKDEDAIVAAIFEDGHLAAYTASFPEMLGGKRVWWCTTLYCSPQYAGRGYGLIVVGSLMEAHEPDLTYDRWGVHETVEICNHLGFHTTYTPRYRLGYKEINRRTLRGKIAYALQKLQCQMRTIGLSKADYTLQYASYIDGEAYAFMKSHHGNNLWLREQDMLNWILAYPFRMQAPIFERVNQEEEFKSNVPLCAYNVVKVYHHKRLIGVYVLRTSADALSIVYIYFAVDYKDIVFASVTDHIISLHPKAFIAEHKELIAYVRSKIYFPKYSEEDVSLSLPQGGVIPDSFTMQLGDGDSFA